MRAIAILLVATACGGKIPETRYYQLRAPAAAPHTAATVAVAIEELGTEPGYDDERIVYRTTPYRFDYYNYHRWSAVPGPLITAYLQDAFANSGRFRAVVREPDARTPITLGGRVLAIEEIDETPTRWVGHILVELDATDTASGRVVWSERYEEREPLRARTPEGLAEALSIAMARIAKRAAVAVAYLAERPGVATRAK